MPYQTAWLIPDRVLLIHYYDELSLEAFNQLAAEIQAICESRSEPIHTVGDTRDLKRFPLNMGSMRNTVQHTNVTGWRVMIVPNPMLRFIITTIARALGASYYFTSSIEDGLDFLKKVDPTLNGETHHEPT